MLTDVSSILKIQGAKLELDSEVGLSGAEFLGERYSFTKPLRLTGEIYNNGQSLTLAAHAAGRIATQCARCLKPIEADVDFDIHELLARAEDGADEDGDIILFDGHEVDLDDIVTDNFLMNISGKYLCRDDCKGLCPVCGHDLNEGDCGCDSEYVDPRWQALKDILDRRDDGDGE